MTEPTVTCRNGHENSAGGRFCETCGVALEGRGPATSPPPPDRSPAGTTATPPPPAPRTSGGAGLSPRFVYIMAAFVAIAAAIATAGAFLLFSGDDDEPAGAESTPTSEAPAPTDTPQPTATPTTAATATATPLPGETRDSALPIGVEKRGFDGWEIFVVRSDFDVVQEVLAQNSLNEPPTDGWTFALVRLSATNREAEPDEGEQTAEYRSFQLQLIDSTGTVYHTFDNGGCGVIPDGFAFIDNPQPRGGTVEGNICFHIPQEITDEVVLFDDGSNTWFRLR